MTELEALNKAIKIVDKYIARQEIASLMHYGRQWPEDKKKEMSEYIETLQSLREMQKKLKVDKSI